MQLVVFAFAHERLSDSRAINGQRAPDVGEKAYRLRRVDFCNIEYLVARKDTCLARFAAGIDDALQLGRKNAHGILAAHVSLAGKVRFEPDAIVVRGLVVRDIAFLGHGVDDGEETAFGRLERAADLGHGESFVGAREDLEDTKNTLGGTMRGIGGICGHSYSFMVTVCCAHGQN